MKKCHTPAVRISQLIRSFNLTALTVAFVAALGLAAVPTDANGDPAEVGQLSPLIPFPIDAIHTSLSWRHHMSPRICTGMRPSEYRGSDLVDEDGNLSETFNTLVYGGFGFSGGPHGLDESNLKGDLSRENYVCWDITHPDAFNDTGQFAIVDDEGEELVSKADFPLTSASITDAGHSGGLNYNIFCSGNVALADGRVMYIGGHDKNGNNAIRKLNIFDPKTMTWEDRGIPAVKHDFLADPEGTSGPHADARDEMNTDPAHPSDMRYQRWYPSGVVLPDKNVLLLSGTDQDTSLGPPATQFFPPCFSTTASAACSKSRANAPEVYFHKLDRTVALENARKLLAMFPRSYVVQTGRGWHDWKVMVISHADENFLPGLGIIGQYDPWFYTGRTYFLDVQAALADPNRDLAAENHWELVDTAKIAHNNGAGAQLWELDRKGHAIHQRVALFGGGCGRIPRNPEPFGPPLFQCDRSTVEMIDFEADPPQWEEQEPLIREAGQNNAVVLPNGKVVIVGGVTGRGDDWVNSFELQLFDPDAGTVETLLETQVARHDHSTVALLPDGSVAIMGGNATDLGGAVEHLEAGIPVAQIYKPAYMFQGPRPVIRHAPHKIKYGRRFQVHLKSHCNKGHGKGHGKGHACEEIGSVVITRIGPVTHNWDWGNRSVELWFKQKKGKLIVQAPARPGYAVPGHYMIFVVDTHGVPSEADIVHLDFGHGHGQHDHH